MFNNNELVLWYILDVPHFNGAVGLSHPGHNLENEAI